MTMYGFQTMLPRPWVYMYIILFWSLRIWEASAPKVPMSTLSHRIHKLRNVVQAAIFIASVYKVFEKVPVPHDWHHMEEFEGWKPIELCHIARHG